ncbi:aminotransferase class IV [Shumkonia mesophila]|uniref:aminotransferase class IV n=1 Tax=Shumkonia mesophila TaxID=2838854 RepID=UPI0029349B73|nr:aminotransferase class IV [Shumkonia mesophila]
MTIWLDGTLIPLESARLRPDDRGFTLGDGLFETLAIRDRTVLRVPAHLARLRAGCAELALPLPYGDDALAEALTRVAAGMETGTARLTVSRGPAPRGLKPPEKPLPTVLITATPASLAPPAPAAVVIAATTRRNSHSPLARLKSLNYLDGIIALMEAHRRGADDALLLNTAGTLAEATAANLFAVIEGVAVTPPIADGALPGLMRAAARDVLNATERSLTAADLEAASEIFLTNVTGIRPVVRLEDRPVGRGRPGPVWASLGGLVLGRERP